MHDYGINKLRVQDLLADIKQTYPDKKGTVVLFAGFEDDKAVLCRKVHSII